MKNKKTVILGGLLLCSIVNFIFILRFFYEDNYLPPPFFYNTNDTFMDFYNPVYWSSNEGVYSIWGSVYPPLNFLFLFLYEYLFINELLSAGDAFQIRNSGLFDIIPLIFIYVISIFLSVLIGFSKLLNYGSKFLLIIIVLLSPPFLVAVERGNLIILCIPILSLYITTKNQVLRAILVALLINLKPYFAILYIVQLLNIRSYEDNKKFIFIAPLLGISIFLLSGYLVNDLFYLLPLNLLGFAIKRVMSPAEALSFASSITAFAYLRGLITEFGISPIIGHFCKFFVYLYLVKFFFLIYKNRMSNDDLFIFAIIFLTNYSTSTGGYALLFYVPVLAIFYKNRSLDLLAIVIIFMFIGIWDFIPVYHYQAGSIYSYLSGETVMVNHYLSLGSILRPIANFLVLVLVFKSFKRRYSVLSPKVKIT